MVHLARLCLHSLSSQLAEVTGNSTYLTAALASRDFTQAHLNGTGDVINGVASARQNDSCPAGRIFGSPDSGWFIDGFSVLGDITKSASDLST